MAGKRFSAEGSNHRPLSIELACGLIRSLDNTTQIRQRSRRLFRELEAFRGSTWGMGQSRFSGLGVGACRGAA